MKKIYNYSMNCWCYIFFNLIINFWWTFYMFSVLAQMQIKLIWANDPFYFLQLIASLCLILFVFFFFFCRIFLFFSLIQLNQYSGLLILQFIILILLRLGGPRPSLRLLWQWWHPNHVWLCRTSPYRLWRSRSRCYEGVQPSKHPSLCHISPRVRSLWPLVLLPSRPNTA